MSETLEYVNHLSREIGPRPAGTEEERQAAEYIAETLEQRSGLPVEIEDFTTPSGNEMPHVICMGIAVVAGVFSLFSSVFAIPALILLVIVTALLIAELKDQHLIMKFFSKGASQNVIAKYEPGFIQDSGRGRRNRIVVVARYDSGKVRNELSGPVIKVLPVVNRISFWSVPALLVLVFIRGILLGGDTGAAGVFFGFLTVVAVVFSLVPIVFALLHRVSPYNEAANSNAAGVAAMMEVANRVGNGRMTEDEIASRAQGESEFIEDIAPFGPMIHGAEEAIAAGAVPEDADLYYEVEPGGEMPFGRVDQEQPTESIPPQDDASSRLLAAKAAIAAMTGTAVGEEVFAVPQEEPVPIEVIPSSEPVAEVPSDVEMAVAAPSVVEEPQKSSVPDWFKAAQEKAKANKPSTSNDNVKRSRYADALDAAVSASSRHFSEANQEALSGMDEEIEKLHDGIVEVKAPGFEDEPNGATSGSGQASSGAQPVVGHAGNDILAGVVEEIDVPEQSAITMPSFLEDDGISNFDRAATMQERVEDRVVVNAYADDVAPQGSEALDGPSNDHQDEASPFALPLDDQEAIEPASDFVGQVTQGFDSVSASVGDPLSLSSRLPRVTIEATEATSAVGGAAKQRAPLADSSSTAKSLLSMLPSIDPQEDVTSSADQGANASTLRATLPSLSGTFPAVSNSAAAGSAGATGVFAPVTDELVKSAVETEQEGELFVEDADDSDYQENFTESGAFAGPDYIEMPSSPVRNFFDKVFHRKKKAKDEPVYYDEQPDDAFAADEQYGNVYYDDEYYDDEYYDDAQYDAQGNPVIAPVEDFEGDYVEKNGERWNGGALSALKDAASSVGGKASKAASDVAGKVHLPNNGSKEDAEGQNEVRRGRFSSMIDEPMGYESSPRSRFEEEQQRQNPEDAAADVPQGEEGVLPDEFDRVQSFRNPDVNAEVWFVALGSELAGNYGMRSFLDQHGSELRGSIIIELDALGGGKLSLVETEGTLKRATTSSRMKRYLRKVAQTTGINCPSVRMNWNDSASSFANGHGQKAMHLVGFENGKPALFAQDNDVVESVDEQTLEENVDIVMELLRII